MSPKSGRFKNVDMGEGAPPPAVYKDSPHGKAMAEFENSTTTAVQRKLVRVAGQMGRRFTLDQFASTWYAVTGATSLDFCQRALLWLEQGGFVRRDGLMHWRNTDA